MRGDDAPRLVWGHKNAQNTTVKFRHGSQTMFQARVMLIRLDPRWPVHHPFNPLRPTILPQNPCPRLYPG